MPQALATIIPAALTGGGFLSNWLNQRKTNERQQFMENLAKNPAAMTAYASQFTKPLSAGLTQNVGNNVQAYLGERGLSETPGISAEVLSQSLAPYQQQEQQMGLNEAFQSLGLMPTGSPAPANLSTPLALLMKQLTKPATPAAPLQVPPSAPGITAPDVSLSGDTPPFDPSILFGGGQTPIFAPDFGGAF